MLQITVINRLAKVINPLLHDVRINLSKQQIWIVGFTPSCEVPQLAHVAVACPSTVGATALPKELAHQQLVALDDVSSFGVVIELGNERQYFMTLHTCQYRWQICRRFVVSRFFTLSRND